MKIILSLLLLLLSPWVVSAGGILNRGKSPPPPEPVVAPSRCSCWWQPVGTGLLLAAPFVALSIYHSKDEKGGEKKVEVVPADHGAMIAAKLVF